MFYQETGYGKHQGEKTAMELMRSFVGFQIGQVIFYIVMGWFSTSLEVFLRKIGSYGERELTWLRLYFSYSVIWLFTWFIAPMVGEGRFSIPFLIIYVVFVVRSLWHRLAIWLRNREGVRWHSMSQGISYLSLLLPNWDYGIIHRWIEPLMCITVAIPFYFFDKVVFAWLFISTLFLWLKRRMEYYSERGMLLDMIDSSIEAEFLNDIIVEQAPPEDTCGKMVLGVNTKNSTKEQREALARSMERADPIRQREDLADDFAEAISTRTLKVMNAATSTESQPQPAKAPVETQDNGSNPVGEQESG